MNRDPVHHVRACIEQALALPAFDRAELEALRQRAAADHFNLVALGEFKRGKSTVLNALLGAEVLPMGVVPVTAIATIVTHGDAPAARVVFQDGETREIAFPQLADYVTEKGNPANKRGVAEVHIHWPSPWLAHGVRIIDTPGIGSVLTHNSEVTYRYLPEADAVLFLLSVDQPAGQAETEFLAQVRQYAGRIFFVLNKKDLVTPQELEESVTFTSQVMARALEREVRLYPVSARGALQAGQAGDAAAFEASGFPTLVRALETFLETGKGQALARALAKRLLRLVQQARIQTELEASSLRTPLDELREKIALFEQKQAEIRQEQRDFDVLLRAAFKHLADDLVTADLDRYRETLPPRLIEALDQAAAEMPAAPLGRLARTLERAARDSVRDAWDRFRRQEDQRMAEQVRHACQRFANRIDAITDELYRFSSELFAIDFHAIRADTQWTAGGEFYYKFWDEPTALKTLTTVLPRLLPRGLGRPLVLRQARRYVLELAATQAGRVRYDFARRLERSRQAFHAAMTARVDATVDAIQRAVATGLERDQQDASRVKQRQRELASVVAALDALADEIQPIIRPPAEEAPSTT